MQNQIENTAGARARRKFPRPRHTTAHRFITATTLLFIAEIVGIHFLYTDRTFASNPLSIYALGDYWYLITSGFLFCAINYLMLAALFWQAGNHASKAFRFGVFALMFLAVDTVAIALFPADFGPTVSLTGWIHEFAAYIHFMVLPVAAFALREGFRGPAFALYNKIATGFALLLVAIGIAIVLDTCLRETDHYSGLLQKALILIIQFWVLYSSWKLMLTIESSTEVSG